MKKKSGGRQGLKLNQDQRTFLQIMAIPLIVIILIVVIRIADQPEREQISDETTGSLSPTVGELETGVTAAILLDLEQERLPEEPGDEPDETLPAETEGETEPESLDAFATERFQRDGVPEILELMRNYFKARVWADAQEMNRLYGIEGVSAQELEAQGARMRSNAKYVQDFENVATYVMESTEPDSWLVYAVADINFYTSKTRAPMVMWCYVKKNSDENYVIVNNRDFSAQALQFIDEANHSDEVRKLASDVNRRLREALQSDENLNQVYGVLRHGSPVWDGAKETEPEVSIVGEASGEDQGDGAGIILDESPAQTQGDIGVESEGAPAEGGGTEPQTEEGGSEPQTEADTETEAGQEG